MDDLLNTLPEQARTALANAVADWERRAPTEEQLTAVLTLSQGSPGTLDFAVGNMHYHLLRITDREYEERRQHSIAIQLDQALFTVEFISYLQGLGMNLAETFLALEGIFGAEGQCFDDWKGVFAFPLALTIRKRDRSWSYLLRVYNYRGSVEFDRGKQVSAGDVRLREHALFPPVEDEFSVREMELFLMWFDGSLRRYYQGLRPEARRTFLMRVPSDRIVFGCRQGVCFTRRYRSDEEYQEAISESRSVLGMEG